MNRLSKKVFDQNMAGAATMYTNVEDLEALAKGRQLAIVAVCDGVVVENVKLTVAIEHSSSGRLFTRKNAAPEIDEHVLGYQTVTTVYGGEATVRPNLKYVRLAVTLTGNAARAAHVVLTVSVRGSKDRPDEEPASKPDPLLAEPPGSHPRMIAMTRDFRQLLQASSHLPPEQRAVHVLGNLSPESVEHLRALDRKILGMHPELRKHVFAMTAHFVRTALELSGGPGAGVGSAEGACCGTTGGPTGCGGAPCAPA
jgi:hypothetical protein